MPPTITDWRGEYYANRTLTAPSMLVRNDRVVDFGFGSGESPAPGVPSENWSARWTRSWSFVEGNYRFRAIVDDGARLWVGELLIIDAWTDGAPREFTANLYLRGEVSIRLEYYNHLGSARARLNWERVTEYPDWKGTYFPNRDLGGLPRLQRNDQALDLNFGDGAPVPYLPADNFSARWTRRLALDQTGTYHLRLVSDDGARVWIDGRLVIDAWRDGPAMHEVFYDLVAGTHDVRVEFYEHLGSALLQFNWSLVAQPATPTDTASPIPPTPTPTPTLTPTPIPPTPTPSPTSVPPKPTLTPTATPAEPTLTPSPTSAAPEPQPSISLEPPAGPIGDPVTVLGQSWPSSVRVGLYLAGLDGPLEDLTPAGDAMSDAQGRFHTRIVIPHGEGWEDRSGVRVVARSDAVPEAVATAVYQFEPSGPGVAVPFHTIASEQERLALSQPTFLVLTSFDEWAPRFGPEPVPADPRINWQQEIVIGVFLGLQPPEVNAEVASIERRGQEIRVLLESAVPSLAGAPQEGGQPARALVRVSRDDLPAGARQSVADVDFSFFDGAGRLLAYGTGTSVALAERDLGPRMLEAPQALEAAPELGAEAIPVPGAEEVVPEQGAEAIPVPSAEEGLGMAPPEPTVAPSPAAVESPPATRVALAWLGLGLWLVLVVGASVGIAMFIWRSRRQT